MNITKVEIKPAKGRPMLQWVGKRTLRQVTAFPAQLVETFKASQEIDTDETVWQDWPDAFPRGGLLFHGENEEVLAHLLANGFRGKVNLVYIDPPFDSGADYVRKVNLRGMQGTAKLNGEGYTLGEQIQYTDIWANDNYLQFMYERMLLLRELLAEDGSIWLHCDWRMVHRLRLLLDEVFGEGNFINEIAWKHTVLGGTHGRRLPKAHETILWYGKSAEYTFSDDAVSARVPFGDYIQKTLRQDEDGRWYYTRGRMSRQPSVDELERKAFTKTYVDDPDAGTLTSDVWDDMPAYRVYGDENVEYPTQKNESLVRRFIELGSRPGDLVLDCFIGSGTTAAVAQKLGRRWIGCDINKGAIQTAAKRLHAIIQEQAITVQVRRDTPTLPSMESEGEEPKPAQLGFAVYRVNDYDLQIQHNEAVNLACEHIGVTRTRSDAFFDGVLGTGSRSRLVKIAPFTHPLSPLDLEIVKQELAARPEESRDVVVVCLGKTLAVDAWLEEWNRLRIKGDFPNKISVIELRTDPRYGKFFEHQPAQARVSIERRDGKVFVRIDDFISPTIIERLKSQAGLLTPQIDDWRAMVDSVMIDTAYDGEVFNVVLADVPERKDDLVIGEYELDAPGGETTVAVKVTDMLGEEVLTTTIS